MPLHRLVTEHPALRKSLPVTLVSLGLMTMGAIFAPAAPAARFTFSQTGYDYNFSGGPRLTAAERKSKFPGSVSGSFEFDEAAWDDNQVTLKELTSFRYKFTLLDQEPEASVNQRLSSQAITVKPKEDRTNFIAKKKDLGFFSFNRKGESYFLNLGNILAEDFSAKPLETEPFYRFDLEGNSDRGRGNFSFNDEQDDVFLQALEINVGLSSSAPIQIQAVNDAVPTPAMLPGLIGMGIAALRKRKQAASSEA
ncbi:PTPA-CTERM sorting domain-containing protein [filamentous cyanobacterium LEGE 11480]|uniref:PTPA-CTERM sorting domain-containing protein n=1 Tax=Romeriopsis navalis LEGE 11480 TaxID=2777977 RepID=A0A928VQX3_9CYAN|nr:PTPA-CTERM sorting domain-containing protein [Romeriopsis navalis]MBE9031301.1 PTPA-CTERM sorting domain-containing protein [Romeriopsis navalis LEGE 11480]